MKSIIFSLFVILFYLGLHSFKSKGFMQKMPVQMAVSQISKDMDATLLLISHLKIALEERDIEKSKSLFVNLKKNFKKQEFFLLHFDYETHSRFINGAPLPKIMEKMNELTILEAQGLQIIEEKLFGEVLDFSELVQLLLTFEINFNEISQQLKRNKFDDADVFEAMRYGIIYLNSIGLTGFDSPSGPEKTNDENIQFLIGIQEAFGLYKSYIKPNHFQQVNNLFSAGIHILQRYNFNNTNRLDFAKTICDPLYAALLSVQRELLIEEPHQRGVVRMPLNYGSTSLFAVNFLSEDYFLNSIFEANKTEVVQLGETLFFDPILSANNQRACASCHHPEKAYTDGLKTSLLSGSKKPGLRNSPSLLNVIFSNRFFHDVRSDELLTQLDHVVLSKDEFNTDYQTLCKKLSQSEEYLNLFKKAFGQADISPSKLKFAITQFIGSLNSFNSPFDQYMRNESSNYSESAKRGYNLFTGKAACATCHFAPIFSGLVPPFFTENESEVLGVPATNKAPYILDKDFGRYANGIVQEKADFFKYSFKTPSLRNIELTAPYMHNGVFETLEEVIDFYNKGGGIGLGFDVPHQTLPSDKLDLSKKEVRDIIAFMRSLTDTSMVVYGPKMLPQFKNVQLNKRTIGGDY